MHTLIWGIVSGKSRDKPLSTVAVVRGLVLARKVRCGNLGTTLNAYGVHVGPKRSHVKENLGYRSLTSDAHLENLSTTCIMGGSPHRAVQRGVTKRNVTPTQQPGVTTHGRCAVTSCSPPLPFPKAYFNRGFPNS